jgi:general secretion pathway protein D
MRYIKFLTLFLVFGLITTNVYAKEKKYIANDKEVVHIDFNELSIEDFIKLVSKITNKNILLTNKIRGNVEFISTTPIYKDQIIDILIYVLESKGYTLVDNHDIYRVVKNSSAVKNNLPIVKSEEDLKKYKQMVTEIITVKKQNVDTVASKIRHLTSKSAKLVTIRETNTFIITDFPDNIKTIKTIINTIENSGDKTVEIIELKNLKSKKIVPQIQRVANTMFNSKIQKEKVDIIASNEINSIMLVGNKKNVLYLKKYIKMLDSKTSQVEKTVEVMPLKNADALKALSVIRGMIGKRKYKDPEMQPYISADKETNSLIFMGPKSEITFFQKITEMLDKDRKQVYVKARIIEISKNKTAQLGVSWGLEGGSAQTTGLYTFAANLGGKSVTLSDALLGYIKPKALTEAIALGVAVDFLEKHNAATVLSEPSILCLDNKKSTIYVGQTRSIITSFTTTDNKEDLSRNTVKREDIGLTLSVKPRISNDNKVTLEIQVEAEDILAGEAQTTGAPTTIKRKLNTIAIVENGESVVVGGLIKNKISDGQNKVAFLGNLPLIGALFRNSSNNDDDINLVVLLTPYIIPKTSSLSDVRQKLVELEKIQEMYYREAVKGLKDKKNEREHDKTIGSVTISSDDQGKYDYLKEEIEKEDDKKSDDKDYYNPLNYYNDDEM